MRTPLDALDPIICQVGYGQLGRSGELGYEGKPVMVGGRSYVSALSTHAPARLVYKVPGGLGIFRCHVALNGDVPVRRSHANFTLLADGRRVAEALRVQAGDPPRFLVADCGEATVLELRVTTSQWAWCHAVWLEPSFEGLPAAGLSPAVITDPLCRADIVVPQLAPGETAIVTAASPGFEDWVHNLFGSIQAFGNVPDARLVLFALGESAELVDVAARHGAVLVPCRPRRPPSPASKAVLYSAAQAVPCRQLLCLDADMLVLGDLGPIFAALDASTPGCILICGEGNDGGFADLRTAFDVLYWGGPDPPFFRRDSPLGSHPFVVNDGLFAGSRDALLAMEEAVRGLPGAQAWIDERAHVGWSNQFVLNVALADLGVAQELDPVWNLQLHVQDVETGGDSLRPRARWQEREVRVLHFNGAGRHKLAEWRRSLRAPDDPLVTTGAVDGYRSFVGALRSWVGRRGVGAGLRWSMFGTADGLSARVHNPGTFPPLALLHNLVLANGCVRVLETGTAQGVSAGCLAAAVVHRPGAVVVSFDPTPWPECTQFWGLLPPSMRQVIEQRPMGSVEGMAAALAAGERYHAAFLDSVHTEEQVWAEFELARQLVVEGGLILVHDCCLPSGTVEGALGRIESEGFGVTRLMTATEGVPEDDGLGLAVIENRCRTRGGI
jgi:predicted O-methyltransferase YrrM